jgi:hypothetical protein
MAKAKFPTPKKKKQPTFARASDMVNATNLAEGQVVDWCAVALEKWSATPEAKGVASAKTQKELNAAIAQIFRAGWEAGKKEPTCFICHRNPTRGGERDASELCQECCDSDLSGYPYYS